MWLGWAGFPAAALLPVAIRFVGFTSSSPGCSPLAPSPFADWGRARALRECSLMTPEARPSRQAACEACRCDERASQHNRRAETEKPRTESPSVIAGTP
jgi:hypothetical protein